ncbi:hypothetical protein K227x_42080 [Rubripirellula lacrimiformis]|uniref:SGNH hydrolase-type esterase domain-containing protein n=1 Tax=Rubripirellula lacrimiformis TaxID=1930273 RepID=A0A517NF99_9BACT|nr:SGNH/GDSL hydrolase family protein [Rubripirellula lacrimiformis]QDT05803.1 hypothetical protein K227x_42080 [Rubripirellula lacrimiformis]
MMVACAVRQWGLVTCLAVVMVAQIQAADADQAGGDSSAVVRRLPASSQQFFDRFESELTTKWPKNRTMNIVFHGHSVPAGYFRDGRVHTFDAYPTLYHQQLCQQYPLALIDVGVTAIGGEHSVQGAKRFAEDVLARRPDLVFIDYGLNDRRVGLDAAGNAWRQMIRAGQAAGVQVVLLTPTPDSHEEITDDHTPLSLHAKQIRQIGTEWDVPVVDSYAAFQQLVIDGNDVNDYLSQPNHPNREGHEVVTRLLLELF